jgi:hypothetical protein
MPLHSQTFKGDQRLEDCLVKDTAHLTLGTKGEFVGKVQSALIYLDDLSIDDKELDEETYGRSTADAVLAFKRKRKIINHSYQNSEDEIVGKMTIKALDDELVVAENAPTDLSVSRICTNQ